MVLASDAEAAGIDPAAVDRWIVEHGGRRVTVTIRAHPAAAERTVQVWTVPRGLVAPRVQARGR